jgi:hypothetical protein
MRTKEKGREARHKSAQLFQHLPPAPAPAHPSAHPSAHPPAPLREADSRPGALAARTACLQLNLSRCVPPVAEIFEEISRANELPARARNCPAFHWVRVGVWSLGGAGTTDKGSPPLFCGYVGRCSRIMDSRPGQLKPQIRKGALETSFVARSFPILPDPSPLSAHLFYCRRGGNLDVARPADK